MPHSCVFGFPVWKPLSQPRQNDSRGGKGVQKNKQTKRKPKMTAGLQEWFRRQTFIGWLACEKKINLNQLEALLACSKPVCMRRKSRSLHSQAFSWRSRSDPSRSPGPSFRTWGCSSNTRCSASCTRVAKWTARPSRLTTKRETQWEGECQQIILVSKQEAFYHTRLFYCQTKYMISVPWTGDRDHSHVWVLLLLLFDMWMFPWRKTCSKLFTLYFIKRLDDAQA